MKVVLWLLHPDPQSRATLADLQKDKWTNQVMDITKYLFEAVITGEQSDEVLYMLVPWICTCSVYGMHVQLHIDRYKY